MLDRSAQKESALTDMTEWLKERLGKAPYKIEHAGGFRLHGMHYYMFRFKKGLLGKWLLGVCGGYLMDRTENCGHVVSDMTLFNSASAQADATAMAERVREDYANRAREILEIEEGTNDPTQMEETGPFTASILLSTPFFDPIHARRILEKDWNVPLDSRNAAGSGDSLLCDIDGMIATASLIPLPIPDGEAEMNAVNNYQWSEAVEVTQTHTAHILAVVISRGRPALEAGKLLVKLCASCLTQNNAIGVYACGTVFRPSFYLDAAKVLKQGGLPLLNWIYIGLNPTGGGVHGYTYGMKVFGMDEIEILASRRTIDEVREFLVSAAYYILEHRAFPEDGQSFSPFPCKPDQPNQEVFLVSRSPGVSVDGVSLKIDF